MASDKAKLSHALKLISKLKTYDINQKNQKSELPDSHIEAIAQLDTISKI